MDALWPDLTVTEASLQRAVSLARRALAAGGLERAIRSFVRHGYRFGIDPDFGAPENAPALADGIDAEARRRVRACDWPGACARFEAMPAERLTPEDIDLWALAVECSGRPVLALPLLARAVAAHEAAGDPLRRGPGGGDPRQDRARAQRRRGRRRLARPGRVAARRRRRSRRARLPALDALAPRHLRRRSRRGARRSRAGPSASPSSPATSGLQALTLAYKGFYNLSLGHVGEGSAQQNHAAAIALSGEIDPVTGSLVYCNILWSARTFADWERAWQWSQGFETWCEASFAAPPGSCDLHRAEILGREGDAARGAGADRSGAGQARRRGGLVHRRGPPRPRRHPRDARATSTPPAPTMPPPTPSAGTPSPATPCCSSRPATPTRPSPRSTGRSRGGAGSTCSAAATCSSTRRGSPPSAAGRRSRRRSSPRSRRARRAGRNRRSRRCSTRPAPRSRPTRPRRGACSSSPASSGPRPGSTTTPRASASRSRATTSPPATPPAPRPSSPPPG